MKIGFDAKRLYNNFTGLGNYSRFIVDALKHSYPQNKYILFTPKRKLNPETEPFFKSTDLSTVLPPSWMSALKLGSAWRSFRIGHEAKNLGVEIYHGLSHELPHDLSRDTRSVVTIHDLIFLRYPQFYNAIDVAIYKSKVKHACKVADVIVAISEQTAIDLEHFLAIDRTKIKVVYQGCHPNFKKKYSDEQLADVALKYNLPSSFILNVGTIEPRKNALLILRALSLLKNNLDVSLVLIGRPTNYLEQIKEFAAQNNLTDRVMYIHNARFEDLPLLYRLADLFVYPSLFEGFGIPLIEAIESGVPVITSNDSCFAEAAGPSAVYIDPRREDELAFEIEKILTDVSFRDHSIQQAQVYIKKFEPPVIAKNMMDVYNSIV